MIINNHKHRPMMMRGWALAFRRHSRIDCQSLNLICRSLVKVQSVPKMSQIVFVRTLLNHHHILWIFDKHVAKKIELRKVHSLYTWPKSCQRTTELIASHCNNLKPQRFTQ